MILKKITLIAIFMVCGITSAFAIETKAKYAILMDADTGDYLLTKDHQKMVPPASMSKLMTLYVILDKLKKGELSLGDTFTVSENAWRKGGAATGGSTMFLKINEKVRIEDLLRGIIIQSGNDACIVAAENISGNEINFANDMTAKAKEMGLKNSVFVNSTGLPHPDHKMSMEDLAILSKALINDFPEYYHMFSEKTYTHNDIKQGNRNPLLYSMYGADGLKTGHTEEAGFCLTASVKRDGRRLIGVMGGMSSMKERSEETEKLMSWGFREFDNYKIVSKGNIIKEIPVWMGDEEKVSLAVSEDVVKTIQKSNASKIKITAIYDTPAKAPIKKGDELGKLKIETSESNEIVIPLVADKDIAKKGVFSKIITNIKYIIFGVY